MPEALAEGMPAASRGPWRDALGKMRRRRANLTAVAILAVLVSIALLGPWVSPYSIDGLDWQHLAAPPLAAHGHWLGTDRLGRDLFARTAAGLRVSLLVSLVATAVSLLIGVSWGAVAGFKGGRLDELMMRLVDVLYSLPVLFIVIILGTVFQRGSLTVLLLTIAAVGWLTTARIVRGQTLALREREFVDAARTMGLGTPAILVRHIVPNLLGPVVVYATLTFAQMITFESFLSFLGLGVQEPLASLGSLINDGAREMESAAWMLLVPAGTLLLLLLSLSVLGDGLRDALDPRAH